MMPGPIIEDPADERVLTSSVLPLNALRDTGAPQSVFIVTYNGFSPEARVAFQAAVDIWASQLQSSVPIRITANWTPLASGVLGSAGPNSVIRNFAAAPSANTWYPIATANKLSATDLDPGRDDIVANFNSTYDWYLGTDGNAGARHDLVTVVLHELGHGLGFLGSMNGAGGVGAWGSGTTSPFAYDRFAINGGLQFLLDTTLFPNNSAALAAQLTGNSLFFSGGNARLANAGFLPRLYAPSSWDPGSSFSHLSDITYPPGDPNSLMTPALSRGEVIHDVGPIARGILTDVGWSFEQRGVGGDFDGDGASEVTVFRPSDGTWYIRRSATAFTTTVTIPWGQSTDILTPDDFDGDGRADAGLFRPADGTWQIRTSTTNYSTALTQQWGAAGDTPVAADYDGDGRADLGIFRPSDGTWYVKTSSTGYAGFFSVQWGTGGDVPLADDFDGDGRADLGIYRPDTGTWYVRTSTTNYTQWFAQQWGASGDAPVVGDYDGDGRADLGIFRPSTGTWYVKTSSTNYSSWITEQWGLGTDVPAPGDYDGDGRTDLGLFRASSGIWYIKTSSTGYASGLSVQWGAATDRPVVVRHQ